ncbi:MAG: hypothetical protein ACP5KG_07640, partial [Myxococcota bacterium]
MNRIKVGFSRIILGLLSVTIFTIFVAIINCDTSSSEKSCKYDTDCSGIQICSDGKCINPGERDVIELDAEKIDIKDIVDGSEDLLMEDGDVYI